MFHLYVKFGIIATLLSVFSIVLSSNDEEEIRFFSLLLYQKMGIAGTDDFESAPTLAAAAEENKCEYVPATDAGEPAA